MTVEMSSPNVLLVGNNCCLKNFCQNSFRTFQGRRTSPSKFALFAYLLKNTYFAFPIIETFAYLFMTSCRVSFYEIAKIRLPKVITPASTDNYSIT